MILQKMFFMANFLMLNVFFLEPHERNGRLLCGEDETIRRPKDGTTYHRRTRLYRIYTHVIPELIYLVFRF